MEKVIVMFLNLVCATVIAFSLLGFVANPSMFLHDNQHVEVTNGQ